MPVVLDTVNVNEIKLGPVKASRAAAGCKTAYIVDKNGSRLSIQTPVIPIPWASLCAKWTRAPIFLVP